MNLVPRSLSLLVMVLLLQGTGSAARTWTTSVVDPYAMGPSMAIDSSFNVHLAYPKIIETGTPGNLVHLYYATNASGQWISQSAVSQGDISEVSLAMDPAGRIHISSKEASGFYNSGHSNYQNRALLYTSGQNGAWASQRPAPELFQNGSLRLDANGSPHLIYYTPSQGLMHATGNAGGWAAELIHAEDLSDSIQNLRIRLDTAAVIDAGGSIHLAYTLTRAEVSKEGYASYPTTLCYATNGSGKWTVSHLDDVGYREAGYASLVLDSFGHAHIAYSRGENSRFIAYSVKYATNISGQWQVHDIGGNDPYPVLAVDNADRVHIFHSDFNNTFALRHTAQTSDGWETFDIGAMGFSFTLRAVIDARDQIHLVYNLPPNATDSAGGYHPIQYSTAAVHEKTQTLNRCYNMVSGGHFYTADPGEMAGVRGSGNTYLYEGVLAYVFFTQEPDTIPVYGFYNTAANLNFYTASREEKDWIRANLPAFRYAGISFYAYGVQAPGTSAIHRFFNTRTGHHFFTNNSEEKQYIQAKCPDLIYEGEAFFAHKDPL